jgi:CubicO group peptidase (beta-lactamase class C family)
MVCTGVAVAGLVAGRADAAQPDATLIDAYFRPYVQTNNFSGAVLVRRGATVLFAKSYGFADGDRRIANRLDTRFHIASLSILFTSTAVLRLIDQGRLSFDTHVAEIVPGVPNGDRITIRELLEQNSGLPDANDLPDYDDLLKAHQTPQSLIDRISGLPPFSEPGGKSRHEEHSGQNLLALIIERKTGVPFAGAMKALVFDPLGMADSGVDDDSPIRGVMARGQQVDGPFGLKPAPAIHWSAKSGNGSAYTTVGDEWKWLSGVLHGPLLSPAARAAMLGANDGYGWERPMSARLGETVWLVGGRSPGFSAFLEFIPNEDVTIIALTNIENAANPSIVQELGALVLGKSYKPFDYHPVPPSRIGRPAGDFLFGPDFYRPSATLSLVSDAKGVTLNWPGGPAAPLLPIGPDRFMDRYYWVGATVVRGPDGRATELDYGRFRGYARQLRAGLSLGSCASAGTAARGRAGPRTRRPS